MSQRAGDKYSDRELMFTVHPDIKAQGAVLRVVDEPDPPKASTATSDEINDSSTPPAPAADQ